MLHRLIILAIIIIVTYFATWTHLCCLGCRPGRYGNTDDTLGVIRLPSCGTIGGPNSSRNFGPGSGTSGSNIDVVKASSSNRNGPSVSISGTTTIPLKTEKALNPGANSSEISVVKCSSSSRIGPSDTGSGSIGIPSSGPSSAPRKDTVRTPGSGPGGTDGSIRVPNEHGYVVPLFHRGNRGRRCTCEVCPCALIEKFVVPVAQVGMHSVDIASEHFNNVTDLLLQHFGVFVERSRHTGPRQAQILHSRSTLYDESVEELRLVEDHGFKQTASATISLVPSLHNSTQYFREIIKKISETVTGQTTSEPSVKVPKEGSNQSIKVSKKVAGRSDQKTKTAPLKPEATSKITAKQIKKTFNRGVKISEKGSDRSTRKTKGAPDVSTQKTKGAPNVSTRKTKGTSDVSTQNTEEAPDISTRKTKGAPDVSTQKTKGTSDVSTQNTEEAPDISTRKTKGAPDVSTQKTKGTSDVSTQNTEEAPDISTQETETASNPPNKSSEIASAATSSAEEHKMLMPPPKQSSKLSNTSDDSKFIRPSENEETYDPGRYCSECARKGQVCMSGCPTAEKRIRREQSKKKN